MMNDEMISRFLDNDLTDREKTEFAAAQQSDPGIHPRVLAFRATREALTRARRYAAPDGLESRIRARLFEPQAAASPHRTLPVREWLDRVLSVGWLRPAIAASAAFVLVVAVLYARPREAVAVGNAIAGMSIHSHIACARPGLIRFHQRTSDPGELSAALSQQTGVPVSLPDLTASGWTLLEGHRCGSTEYKAIHVFYQSSEGRTLSYFLVTDAVDSGRLGRQMPDAKDCFCPISPDCGEKERARKNVVLWRDGRNRVNCLVSEQDGRELARLSLVFPRT